MSDATILPGTLTVPFKLFGAVLNGIATNCGLDFVY